MLPPLHLKSQLHIIWIVNWGETWTHFGSVSVAKTEMIRAEATEPMHADSGPLKTWQQTVKSEEFRINLFKGKRTRTAKKAHAIVRTCRYWVRNWSWSNRKSFELRSHNASIRQLSSTNRSQLVLEAFDAQNPKKINLGECQWQQAFTEGSFRFLRLWPLDILYWIIPG